MTTTFPVVAPLGTVATIVVLFQLLVVAVVPLNFTVLPEEVPKVVPVMVTVAPTAPEDTDKLVILGVTVNALPLLATPDTVTTTFPVVAALGTVVTMVVEFQELVDADVPLKETLPEEPKFVPVMVTDVPTGPELTERLVIVGEVAMVAVEQHASKATPEMSLRMVFNLVVGIVSIWAVLRELVDRNHYIQNERPPVIAGL